MKAKEAAKKIFTGLDRFSQVVGSYVQVVNTTRAFTEMSIPVAPGAKTFNRSIIPLHILGLISVGFEPITMGKSLKEMIKAPKYLKIVPTLKLGTSIGNVLDAFGTAIWICEQLNVSGIQVLSAVSVPIGGVALGLQALGIGILSWKVHSVHKQWKAVEKALGKQPGLPEYKAAVHLLTKKPETKKEKYTQKFFGVLTDSQKDTIKKIYKKVKAGDLDTASMDQTIALLKNHHFQQKVQNGISIALMIIGVVGLTLVAFAPTPVTPIAWGIVGCVGVGSMGLFAYSLYKNHQFNNSLNKCLQTAQTTNTSNSDNASW